MKEIENLIHIITKFSPSKLPLLNQGTADSCSLESRLYQNIKAGKYKEEKDAIIDLYGKSEDYYKYQMLKSRLRQKLYNHLHFVQDKTRAPRVAEKKCFDLVHQAKALIHLTEYSLAEVRFNKALRTAFQYEFTDIVIDCLASLNFIYTQLRDGSKFYKTLKLLKEYKILKIKEDEAYEIYYVNNIELQKSVLSQKKVLQKLPPSVEQVKKLWQETKSYNIFYHYYMLSTLYHEFTGDYLASIEESKKWKNLFTGNKINTKRFNPLLNNFLIIYSLLRAKKFKQGLVLAPKYLREFDPFSRNWFAYMLNYFLLAVHSGNYKLATEIVQKVDQNPYYYRLNQKHQESWRLHKSHLYFLNADKNNTSTFQYQEFISSVPIYSKDKLGYNISILILQFLYLLKNKEFEQLYSKEDTLRKYAHNYLKTDHSKRSFCFFKLMLVVIRVDFDPEKGIRKGKPWFDKLKITPEPGDAYTEVEIIPYEKLWEIVLGLLK